LDFGDLILLKVDLPVDDLLKYSAGDIQIQYMPPLSSVVKMLKVFSIPPEEERLHIVIKLETADAETLKGKQRERERAYQLRVENR